MNEQEIIVEFRKFLSYNIALSAFRKNIADLRLSLQWAGGVINTSVEELIRSDAGFKLIPELITIAFDWLNSPEGMEYWRLIDQRWRAYLKKYKNGDFLL